MQSEAQNEGQTPASFVRLLEDVVVWMDIEDDNGNNIPINHDNLMKLPYAVLSSVLELVNNAVNPEKKSPTPSGGSFSADA